MGDAMGDFGDYAYPPVRPRPDIFELLAQELIWCPRDNNLGPVPLKEMTIEHRRNLYRFLLRRAAFFKRKLEQRLLANQFFVDDLEDLLDRAEALERMDAQEWMHDQPLVVRLRRQLAKHDRRVRRAWIQDHIDNGEEGRLRPSFVLHGSGERTSGVWLAGRNGHTVQLYTMDMAKAAADGVYIYPVNTDHELGVELIDRKGRRLAFSIEQFD